MSFRNSMIQIFSAAGKVLHESMAAIKDYPQILFYPYIAAIFVLLTSPIIASIVIPIWHSVSQPNIIGDVTSKAPHTLLVHLGLVTFSVFYAVFVLAYFSCAIAAESLAKLEQRPVSLTYGIQSVLKNFLKVTKFACLAIFFFPLSLVAQRHKLKTPRGIFEVIGSSFSLSMAQMAPVILTKKLGVMDSIRNSVNTLGRAWRISLLLRIGIICSVLLLSLLGFLPKFIQHHWLDKGTSQLAAWAVGLLLTIISYTLLKVIGGVITTVIYHKAETGQFK